MNIEELKIQIDTEVREKAEELAKEAIRELLLEKRRSEDFEEEALRLLSPKKEIIREYSVSVRHNPFAMYPYNGTLDTSND